jgi:glutamyl-tRNA synthetase
VIRFKAPRDGETVIDDAVQGEVRITNAQLDDMVLLRADGTPTYMLSVVVDDHDMAISHVIRGDDHLTNAFRQTRLYRSLGWQPPRFAHIPLIHGADGAKMSKRHGALGVDAYRDMGFLPEAVCNYLLRLGWSHGDDEIIARDRAVEWFDLDGVGRSPARFDLDRLTSLNGHYMREADDRRLIELIRPRLEERLGKALGGEPERRVTSGMPNLKSRANTLLELFGNSLFYVSERPLKLDEKAARLLDDDTRELLRGLRPALARVTEWDAAAVETAVRAFVATHDLKLGRVAQPLRASLTGSTVSPGIFEVAAVLGRDETLARLDDVTS